MKVRIQKNALSDGSHVFNVVLLNNEQSIELYAVDERAAQELADTIVDAVNRLTVTVARHAFA